MHINIRSLPANFDKLQSLLANMKLKPHIISINGTWLNNNQKGESSNLSNYVFISNNRIHSRGGVLHCMLIMPYHLVFVMIYL